MPDEEGVWGVGCGVYLIEVKTAIPSFLFSVRLGPWIVAQSTIDDGDNAENAWL